MRPFLAKELFDLQQRVVDRCLELASLESDADADGKRHKDEFLNATDKALEVQDLFLVHIPRD